MKKSVIRNVQKSALTVSAVLLAIVVGGTPIAMENATVVSGALDQPMFEITKKEGTEVQDTEYYKSGFNSIKEVVKNGYKVQVEEQLEGTVLLKNKNNALPLTKGSKVSLFGGAAYDPFYGAGGSGGINSNEKISWKDAFEGKHYDLNDANSAPLKQNYAANNIERFKVNGTVWSSYNTLYSKKKASSSTTKVNIGDVAWNDFATAENLAAIDGDTAIMILKRTGGEGYDLPATSSATKGAYSIDKTSNSVNDGEHGNYLELNANEKSVLKGLKGLKDQGKVNKIVLILNMASTIQLDFIDDEQYGVDAAVWAGSVGEYGTEAVAKLLLNEDGANFSGGLSTTLWANHLLNPVNANFTDQNYYFQYSNYADFNFPEMTQQYQSTFSSYLVYQEGMYLGYKYTETRYEDYVKGVAKVGDFKYNNVVSYPFGYGNSYTTFKFSDMKVKKNGDNYDVTVTVSNTGSKDGKTPVQVYVHKPYGEYEVKNQIQVPSVELVDFGKTGVIKAGQSETVTVSVPEKLLTTYDANGAGTYVLTAGKYSLTVANGAHEAINNVLAKEGFTPASTNNRMDAAGDAKMVYDFNQTLNKDKYAYSTQTNNPIRNAFDFVDINKYDGRGSNSVKYVDRADWEGTTPLSHYDANGKLVKDYAKLTMTKAMADTMRDQMDATKVIEKGGEYPTYGAQNGLVLADMMNIPFDDPLWDKLLDQMTFEETANLLSQGRHQTTGVESITKTPMGDENGPNGFSTTYNKAAKAGGFNGATNPLGERKGDPDVGKGYSTTGFSSNGILAATYSKEIARKVGDQIAEEGLWSGKAGLLGLGLNIQRSPYSGRTAEYYSEDANLTGLIAAPQVAALQTKGINCFIKHCAINESETARHGVCQWMTEQTMRENYLRAFELPIEQEEGKAAMSVMTSFARMGVWATANCVDFTQKFLRSECGLMGIVETDAAGDMTDGAHGDAYVSRICNVYTQATDLNEYNYSWTDEYDWGKKGSDVHGPFKYTDAQPKNGVGDYGNLAQAMRASAKRILYATSRCAGMNGVSSDTIITAVTPAWMTWLKTATIVLSVCTALSGAWLVVDLALPLILKKKNG